MTAAVVWRIIGADGGTEVRQGPRERELGEEYEHFDLGTTTGHRPYGQGSAPARPCGDDSRRHSLVFGAGAGQRPVLSEFRPPRSAQARSCFRYPRTLPGRWRPSWQWRGRREPPAAWRRSGFSAARSPRRQRGPTWRATVRLPTCWPGSLVVLAGLAAAAMSAVYTQQILAARGDFAAAFGADWQERIPAQLQGGLLPQRWTWKLAAAPGVHVERDVVFATVPGTDRKLLADMSGPARRRRTLRAGLHLLARRRLLGVRQGWADGTLVPAPGGPGARGDGRCLPPDPGDQRAGHAG